jgi:hypothetical protein
MLYQPIYETFTREHSTYERRTEWSSQGYAYVTMHDSESRHGWGGFMSRSEWDLAKDSQPREKNPAEREHATA